VARWFRRDPVAGTVVVSLHVQPRAPRTEVVGPHGDSLKVRVAAPAVESRANALLVAFVAERFGVARRDVTLLAGEKSREKRLEVRSSAVDPEAALAPTAARERFSR
jgi:uncharacterized protein (TIGR00251 family)